ncbi:MAG: hypothetical protein CM1200mP40_14250 [Gammaproteobacteria bacterium]|nr:MAG: hypothetical protein CM1200mP40_14250 [Gammaproteobacteria bacterium]
MLSGSRLRHFSPGIVLGIFQKRMNSHGAIAGMIAGFLFTAFYIIYFKTLNPAMDNADGWLLGISPGKGNLGPLDTGQLVSCMGCISVYARTSGRSSEDR